MLPAFKGDFKDKLPASTKDLSEKQHVSMELQTEAQSKILGKAN